MASEETCSSNVQISVPDAPPVAFGVVDGTGDVVVGVVSVAPPSLAIAYDLLSPATTLPPSCSGDKGLG